MKNIPEEVKIDNKVEKSKTFKDFQNEFKVLKKELEKNKARLNLISHDFREKAVIKIFQKN